MKRSAASGWNFLLSLERDGNTENQTTKKFAGATVEGENSRSPSTASPRSPQTTIPQGTNAEELLHLNDGAKLVICVLGKPGRGKTHISCKIVRYVSWLGYRTKHFETAEYIRKKHGAVDVASFFDPNNATAVNERRDMNDSAILDLCKWLRESDGQVALFDATNGTIERREFIINTLERELRTSPEAVAAVASSAVGSDGGSYNLSYRLLWLECECENSKLVEENFISTRHQMTDYKDLDEATALERFRQKEQFYSNGYVGIMEAAKMPDVRPVHKEVSCIKLIDFGDSVLAHRVHGFLEAKLVSFVMNIHTQERTIYLVRHGQSVYNVEDKLGGDSELTSSGELFAERLKEFMEKEADRGFKFYESDKPGGANESNHDEPCDQSTELLVWTSTLRRTMQSAEEIKCRAKVPWRLLSEIDAGICEGMTYAEMAKRMPLEYSERQRNKLTWRYPRGESYVDVLHRLEPVIFELERLRKPVLVVAHRAVLRCLYSYLVGIDTKRVCFLPLPLHTVVKLTSSQHGWKEHRYALGPDVGDRGAHESDVAALRAAAVRKQAKLALERKKAAKK